MKTLPCPSPRRRARHGPEARAPVSCEEPLDPEEQRLHQTLSIDEAYGSQGRQIAQHVRFVHTAHDQDRNAAEAIIIMNFTQEVEAVQPAQSEPQDHHIRVVGPDHFQSVVSIPGHDGRMPRISQDAGGDLAAGRRVVGHQHHPPLADPLKGGGRAGAPHLIQDQVDAHDLAAPATQERHHALLAAERREPDPGSTLGTAHQHRVLLPLQT